eukprot:SAG31_NODE_2010_length_6670_cov_3.036220_3_plen_143_part_00
MEEDPNGCLSSWDPMGVGGPCVGWAGVHCDDLHGHITRIDRHYESDNCRALAGTIPESIGKLSHVQYLDLSHTMLSGTIPNSLGELSELQQLFLYDARISGSIPESLGQLELLRFLYVDSTHVDNCASFCEEHSNIGECYCK